MKIKTFCVALLACLLVSCCEDDIEPMPTPPVEPEQPEQPIAPPTTDDLIKIKINDEIMAIIGSNTWNAIARGNVLSPRPLVAVGNNGYLVTSINNGLTWLAPVKNGTYNWNGIAAGAAKLIACGNNGYIIRSNSNSAINWLTPIQVCNANLNGIAYGNGTFVTVSDNQYITSSNDEGVTWKTPVKVLAAWYSVTFGNGKFVTVGTNGNIATSADNGKTWSLQKVGGSYAWYSVTFGNGKFVAVGQGYVTTSIDGVIWTTPTKVGSEYHYCIGYNDGIFVIGSDTGYVRTSGDGEKWSDMFNLTDESGNPVYAKINGIIAVP